MISIVVATGVNGEIGKGGDLLWSIPSDLKRFKEITTKEQYSPTGVKQKNLVVMGRKTFESLPFKNGLPNRGNIILTKNEELLEKALDPEYEPLPMGSIKEVLSFIGNYPYMEVFIIGGGEIYKQFLPYVDRIYLTEVEQEFPEADTFFNYRRADFDIIEESEDMEENGYKFKFITLDRIKS